MKTKTLFFVTTNVKKVREYNRILKSMYSRLKIKQLKSPKTIHELRDQDVVKVAKDKARKVAKLFPNKMLMVEDTSFYIKALKGPGCLIDRETKKHHGYDYWCHLLNRKGIKGKARATRAETAIALSYKNKKNKTKIRIFKGTIKGIITEKPKVTKFGWDGIFEPQELGKTFVELGPRIKDRMSMRKKALWKLARYLNKT